MACSQNSKTRNTDSTEEPTWSELQTDLLQLILKKLSSFEIIIFRSICTSWNSAAESYKLSQTPWLINPTEGQELDADFFNLEENNVQTIKNVFESFPKHTSRWGSSHGWLVILDKEATLHLFNPITGASIELPEIEDIPDTTRLLYWWHIYTARVFFEEPTSGKNVNYLAVIGIRHPARLSFCKQGHISWTDVDGVSDYDYHTYHIDMVFHNDQLFTLDHEGSVEVWDFIRVPFPIMKTHHLRAYTICNWNGPKHYAWLVVSTSGEILRVESATYNDQRFFISKLNLAAEEWEKVDCLGDQVLFLAPKQSMALSARDCPGCEENSIYFTFPGKPQVVRVYSLNGNKVVEKSYNFHRKKTTAPLWIVPDPR